MRATPSGCPLRFSPHRCYGNLASRRLLAPGSIDTSSQSKGMATELPRRPSSSPSLSTPASRSPGGSARPRSAGSMNRRRTSSSGSAGGSGSMRASTPNGSSPTLRAVHEDADGADYFGAEGDDSEETQTQYDERDTLEDGFAGSGSTKRESPSDVFSGPAHYLPLIVAVVPPLGAILHGRAEAWTDFLILLIVAFYLYQVVRVPWELYYASRTRRINAAAYANSHTDDNTPASVIQRRKAAQAELQQKEMFSLALCVFSPFIGSYLLYYVRGALSEPERFINPFNIRLFVLASGVKPWSHFFGLVKKRSLFLQSEIHYPTPTVSVLQKRIDRLENDLHELKLLHATKADVKILRDGIDLPLTKLNKAIKNYERKEEFIRLNNEEKFELLNDKIALLVNELNISADYVDELRKEVEKKGNVWRILRYVLNGNTGNGKNQEYMWYERGPFFYLFLPVIASNRVLDATGRLFSDMSKTHIGHFERSGMIESNGGPGSQANRFSSPSLANAAPPALAYGSSAGLDGYVSKSEGKRRVL